MKNATTMNSKIKRVYQILTHFASRLHTTARKKIRRRLRPPDNFDEKYIELNTQDIHFGTVKWCLKIEKKKVKELETQILKKKFNIIYIILICSLHIALILVGIFILVFIRACIRLLSIQSSIVNVTA